MRRLNGTAFAAFCGIVLFGAPSAEALEKAGISAAVHGNVTRINQGEPVGIALASGDAIYRFDRITSGPDSGLQVMLLDETTLTIGPNSSIAITEFVYDPSSGAGKVAASIGKGVFRFVSGRIAQHDPASMTIQLPTATIGVRGTMVFGESGDNNATIVLGGPGPDNNTGDKSAGVDITTANGRAELRRPGWAAFVTPGQPPMVQRLPPGVATALLNAVHPEGGGERGGTQGGTTGGETATQASGQGSAGAVGSANGAGSAQNTSLALYQSAVFASQQSNELGLTTTFDQLRALTSGTGRFEQSNVPLSGAGGNGTYIFQLNVNFGTRTASGRFDFTFTSGPFATLVPNGALSIASSYLASTGPALFSTTASCGAAICQGSAQLQNVGATIAAQAAHSLTVSSTAPSIIVSSGSGVAPRR